MDRLDLLRVQQLLTDSRIYALMETPEFRAVKYWLTKRQELLSAGGELLPSEADYLCGIEKHIELIDPHTEIITVNGVPQTVQFLTKINQTNGKGDEGDE